MTDYLETLYKDKCKERDEKWEQYLKNNDENMNNELLREYSIKDYECIELYNRIAREKRESLHS